MKQLTISFILALTATVAVSAQSADKLYKEGKAYMKGKKGLPADQQKAKAWLTKAVKNDKDGSDILKKMRKEAKEGDEDARQMLKLVGKS